MSGCSTTENLDVSQKYENEIVFDGAYHSLKDVDEQPSPIKRIPPRYPQKWRAAKLEGAAKVWFIVDKEGNPIQVQVEEATNWDFAKAALDAIKQWEFTPGKINGEPVNTQITLPLTWDLY